MASNKSTDVTTILRKDHRKVKEMFDQFEELGDRAIKAKHKLALEICEELSVHAQAEEDIFYPALQALAEKEPIKLVAEANEEHALAKSLIAEIQSMDPSTVTFSAKVKVLGDIIKHHVKEEESDIFEQCKENMEDDELQSLGQQVLARKEELMASGFGKPEAGRAENPGRANGGKLNGVKRAPRDDREVRA